MRNPKLSTATQSTAKYAKILNLDEYYRKVNLFTSVRNLMGNLLNHKMTLIKSWRRLK